LIEVYGNRLESARGGRLEKKAAVDSRAGKDEKAY
jgi:hypothetical protein